MEQFIEYSLKSAGVLSIFVLVYHFLLRRLTFFQANRWFLIVGIIASMTFPLVEITQTVYVEQTAPEYIYIPQNLSTPMAMVLEQPAIPVETPFDYWQFFGFLYLAVVAFFIGKMIVELTSLFRLIKSGNTVKEGKFVMVMLSRKLTPFSFFNYICYSDSEKSSPAMDVIIDHEKVHAQQWHSIDVLLSHLYRAVFWMNPLAWWLKKQIGENLEFIADSEAKTQTKSGVSYERTLLSSAAFHLQPSLANNFFTPFIKKRIMMLQKEASARWNVYKYALILPVIVVFLYSFNVVTEVEYIEAEVENQNQKEIQNENQNGNVIQNKVLDDENLNIEPDLQQASNEDYTAIVDTLAIDYYKVIATWDNSTKTTDLDSMKKELESKYGVKLEYFDEQFKDGKMEILGIHFYNNAAGMDRVILSHPDTGSKSICVKYYPNAKPDRQFRIGSCLSDQELDARHSAFMDYRLNDKLVTAHEYRVAIATGQFETDLLNGEESLKRFNVNKLTSLAVSKTGYSNGSRQNEEFDWSRVNFENGRVTIKITPTTTKESLEDIKTSLKDAHNVDFKYSKLKYKDGKLVRIKIELDDNKGSKMSQNYNNNRPIPNICITGNMDGDHKSWVMNNCEQSGLNNYRLGDVQYFDLNQEDYARLTNMNLDSIVNIANLNMINMDSIQDQIRFQIQNLDMDSIQEHIKSSMIFMNSDSLPIYFDDLPDMSQFEDMDFSRFEVPNNISNTNGYLITSNADGKKPLIIIDGVESDESAVDGNMDMSNVESISILKDKKATSLYGSKGEQGVVIITTKNKNGLNSIIEANDRMDILIQKRAQMDSLRIERRKYIEEQRKALEESRGIKVDSLRLQKRERIEEQRQEMMEKREEIRQKMESRREERQMSIQGSIGSQKDISDSDTLLNFSKAVLEKYGEQVREQGYSFKIKTFKERDGKIVKLKIEFAGTDYAIATNSGIKKLTFNYFKDGSSPRMISVSN